MWWNAQGITDPQLLTDHLINFSLIIWSTIHWSTDDQLITADQLVINYLVISRWSRKEKFKKIWRGCRGSSGPIQTSWKNLWSDLWNPNITITTTITITITITAATTTKYKQGKREYRTVRNTNKGNCRNWSQRKHGKQIGASCRGSRNWNYLQNTPWIPLEFAFRMPLACASIN